ncbi:RAB40 [Lepeophtheirus salmonis]|uniref:RAB40 n=1 Tax=Lepeophtheirus salmonis TaxID=72036 RepID=A0A817FBN1_LEPSM|nr:RAB40 [Lepeophtheirus salmonis]CAG9475882.1 RAB40 [Lepeophtheirus salmonis]
MVYGFLHIGRVGSVFATLSITLERIDSLKTSRQNEVEDYAEKNSMGFFEVSPLVNFNISESFIELARMALKRNGIEKLWRLNKVSSLYELCADTIVNRTSVYGID